jgi:uncharacterized Fe-S cluster protein YjdI
MNHNPEVFQPQSAPWIKMDRATTESLKETVDKCPTGAISYLDNPLHSSLDFLSDEDAFHSS